MSDSETPKGASNNERLLAAAKHDNEELILQVFSEGEFDINFQDGLGNTALHYAASRGSTDVLEHILSHDDCDVDPVNRLGKSTPLHLALNLEDPNLRRHIIESLLDAGADTRIKDKNGDTVVDLLTSEDGDIRALIRKAQVEAALAQEEVANSDGDGPGSGSGSDSE